MKAMLFLLMTILLSSCASSPKSRVITDVTKFHTLDTTPAGKSFSVESTNSPESLETRQYLAMLSQGFQRYGWIPNDGKQPDFRVTLDFGISQGRDVQDAKPIFGQTGGGTTQHSGTISTWGADPNYATFSGTSYQAPSFGIVGAVPVTVRIFDRFLEVKIFDPSGTTVLEGKCTSIGQNSHLSAVMPEMIQSFFKDFPGTSGKRQRIEIADQ